MKWSLLQHPYRISRAIPDNFCIISIFGCFEEIEATDLRGAETHLGNRVRGMEMKAELGKELSESGYDVTPLGTEAVERLAQNLNEEEYRVLLDHGTEPPFCGTLLDNKLDGTYACRLCGLPLFTSKHKFESGTGWPSFYAPFDKEHLQNIEDNKYGMRRIEIRCARCGSHQGHVFPDGPPPTGQRYCLNSVSLEFFGEGADIPQKN
jgi:peptide-methionine (R)-S-oxide reductase